MMLLVLLDVMLAAACGSIGPRRYEYEEELYLSLDGSATLNVNSSVPALVALRGADLPLDPTDRLDRERVRALFSAPGIVPSLNLSRRHGRRFVHLSIDVDDVRQLSKIPALAWSRYRFERSADAAEYQQIVGPSAGKPLPDIGRWTGNEIVAFRLHVPSDILFHNSSEKPQRGNILEWEQRLVDRVRSEPLDVHVRMEPESILYTTLQLFGATIVAAAATFALILWWMARRGRGARLAESRL